MANPGSERQTEAGPVLDYQPEEPRVIVEPQVQDGATVGESVCVDTSVHPPDKELGIEFVGARFVEYPLCAPLAQSEDDRFEVSARVGEEVFAVETFEDAGPFELPKTLREQTA